jgi:hypothetical protein
MLTMVYRLLALALIAVSFAGTASAHSVASGEPFVVVHGSELAEADVAHATSGPVLIQAELSSGSGCDGSGHHGNNCCPGAHAHCCAGSSAHTGRDTGLDLPPPARRAWGSFESALPSGERIYPPHRPPRISA